MSSRDISSLLLGALVIGFPFGYIVGGIVNRNFYKK